MGMSVNNNPDIDFPAADRSTSRSPAPRRPRWKIRSPKRSRPRCARQRRRRDQFEPSARATAKPSSSSTSAPRPTARSTTSATRCPRSAATCPTASSSRRSAASIFAGDPILYRRRRTTDMTLEQLSWYVDNNVSRRLLGVEGVAAVTREGGVDRNIRVDPRSRRAPGPGDHRRAGQPAASPDQPQRRRRPRRNRRFGAVGARARQCPTAYDLSQTQIAVPGGRTVRLADLGEVQGQPIRNSAPSPR